MRKGTCRNWSGLSEHCGDWEQLFISKAECSVDVTETLLGTNQDEHGKCGQNLSACKLHCVLISGQLLQV